MSTNQTAAAAAQTDRSDVERRVGGARQWAPLAPGAIRRWMVAMDYGNPLHRDERSARTIRQ